ncbi:MAG: nuclear transport factor 2 family protein [Pseudomonadota bacterium]
MNNPLTLVQHAYAAFGRGDVPALLNLLAPDVRWEFVGDRKAPYTGRVQGRSQVGEWFLAVAQADGIQAFEPRQFLVGPDHVTVLGWERTQALPEGRLFEAEWVHVWQVRDDQLARFWGMLDTEASARARL